MARCDRRLDLGAGALYPNQFVQTPTLVVILTSIFFGIYLYGIDLALNALMGWLYTRFGAA